MAAPRPVIIEIELTPCWWHRLTNHMGKREPALAAILELHARACDIAFKLGDHVHSLKTERTNLVARVLVPNDVSLQVLCEKAGALVEDLNALDVSCLEEARAKYL